MVENTVWNRAVSASRCAVCAGDNSVIPVWAEEHGPHVPTRVHPTLGSIFHLQERSGAQPAIRVGSP